MEMPFHALLARQVRRHLPSVDVDAPPWPTFLASVSRAYGDADDDRVLVERAMQISSEELVEAHNELRGIMHALPDLILHLDAQGRVVGYRGQSQYAAWQSDQVSGRPLADICANSRVAAEQALESTITNRQSAEFDLTVHEGSVNRVFDIRLAPVGRTNALAVVRDVTSDRQAENLRVAKEAAEASSRAKSAFLANMSHELRTPLNAILGYSELLAEDAPDATRRDLEQIRASAAHLLSIVNALLDVARIEAGRMSIDIDHLDLGSVVNDVVESVRPLADRNGNTVETTVDASVEAIATDAAKVGHILLNLVGNACKFTRNGRISITVVRWHDADSQGVACAVTDTGIGIDPAHLDRLFEDFTQVDESTTRRFGGTGLGLAISRRLAGLLGGRIEVTSAPGQGSTFTLFLPHCHPTVPGTAGARIGAPTLLETRS